MKKLLEVLQAVSLACYLVLATAVVVQADDPPPTPTLAPVVGSTTSATQTLQLQEFARRSSYLAEYTTVITATTSGAAWVLERRFTYGEASITIVGMALVLIQAFGLMYKVVTGER